MSSIARPIHPPEEAKTIFSDIPRARQPIGKAPADLVANVAIFVAKGED
jgi:hypothetical protein